jgi:hypothetical protein
MAAPTRIIRASKILSRRSNVRLLDEAVIKGCDEDCYAWAISSGPEHCQSDQCR